MRVSVALAVIPRAALVATTLVLAALVATALVVAGQPSPAPPLPSPTGPARNGLIAYDSRGDIWTMNPDGTGARQLTSGTAFDVAPMWSPDGTKIAFWSNQTGTLDFSKPDNSLVVMNADGSSRSTLADGIAFDGFNRDVSWAPDGRSIAFAMMTTPTVHSVTVISLDGSPVQHLVDGQTPSWSPDGSHIAYRSGVPASVWVIPAAGGAPARVTQFSGDSYAFYSPSWSPDGSGLVTYFGPGDHDIETVGVDGSEERTLSSHVADEYWPEWGPTGRILYFRVIDSQPTLVVVDADGSDERVLDGSLTESGAPAAWSPDGTRILGGDEDPATNGGYILHVIDPDGIAQEVSIPIADSVGTASWQRLMP